MELLKAIKRKNRIDDEADKLEKWLNHTAFSDNKPVHGLTWVKVEKAITQVIDELLEESQVLEEKINLVAQGLEIDHTVK